MNLIDIIKTIDDYPAETCICARRPWTPESEVLLTPLAEDLRIPTAITSQGFEYFLEVFVVRDILQRFLRRKPTLEQIIDFVIYYAENDAFPQWAYE